MTLTAVQYGVGPVGSMIVEVAANRGIEFVGAIDIDPDKVGRDLGEVTGSGTMGVQITDETNQALGEKPDIVLHSTLSSITAVQPQLERSMAAGADVISTCEELTYPWYGNEETAEALDRVAREYDVTCLGTGINPGFAMDTLPAVLSTVSRRVDAVRVQRVQDAATRREPLQRKIGAGTDIDTFEEEIAPKAGHVGLSESVALLAEALEWNLDAVDETVDPVVADEPVESDHVTVEAGEVAGVHQVAHGFIDGGERIELDLQMAIGAGDPHDTVRIDGEPELHVRAVGGFHGDVTTPAIVTNVVPSVRAADSGLTTMLDIATPTYAGPH